MVEEYSGQKKKTLQCQYLFDKLKINNTIY